MATSETSTALPAQSASPPPSTTPAARPVSAKADSNIWEPLPATQWNADTARHLFRRAAWSAQPEDVERALTEGMQATLNRLFPEKFAAFPRPVLTERFHGDTPEFYAKIRAASADEKRVLQKEQRERAQQAEQDMTIKWLQFAANPELSAQEKWTLFLSDIYVVSFEKVRNPAFIHLHHALIRELGMDSAVRLAKIMSRSPAMIRYLDLQESKKDAPNENFARELFELFTLGEGNYTEQDIKQAARAFTGYRIGPDGKFTFAARQHDTGVKKVFGHSGDYTGDDVIDLVFKQRAASAFVPHEMVRFYLTDDAFPKEHLETLGAWWATKNHSLRALAQRFFGSRLFYDQAYVGNYIKSPFQFYFGLVQDLRLDVTPLPRNTINPLRQMGQMPFQPPNVRGWVGGRAWINSATLGARRQLVQYLFTPFNEANLNADEQIDIVAARADGRDHFVIDQTRLQRFVKLPPEPVAETFIKTFLPGKQSPAYREEVVKFLTGDGKPAQYPNRVRNTAITLLQSPEYQLC